MGTPVFAVPCLERLTTDGHEVTAVITQKDRPKGRKLVLTPPPVKLRALESGIKVYQPEILKEGALLPLLKEIKPDMIIVVAYGKILPRYLLDFPKYGCINIHASLLPEYRGAAPINWAVINGEIKTGVTSMHMAEGLDTGDMILKSEILINKDDTAGTLHDKLAALAAENLSETLRLIESGKSERTAQSNEKASYAPMLTNENTRIDFSADARKIGNLVRGLNPAPAAYTFLGGKKIKVLSCEAVYEINGAPGEILLRNNSYYAAGGVGAVKLMRIIPENSREMSAAEYFCGLRGKINCFE